MMHPPKDPGVYCLLCQKRFPEIPFASVCACTCGGSFVEWDQYGDLIDVENVLLFTGEVCEPIDFYMGRADAL